MILELNGWLSGPRTEAVKCLLLHILKQSESKVGGAQKLEKQALEILKHGSMQLACVILAKDLSEGLGVPALEESSLFPENQVIKLWVSGNHERLADQARLEHFSVSDK